MLKRLRFLLLQARNHDDPMRQQEVSCFAQSLHCDEHQIKVFDLLNQTLTRQQLDGAEIVLIGGSGHYGAVNDAPWLERALDSLREIHRLSKPTFGSCWGFQAMSRALGGTVIKDLDHAELGTQRLKLTPEGRMDPLLGPLGELFHGQMGHEDRVSSLPENAILLASSDRVTHQAYCFRNKPLYFTQFHPELTRDQLLERLRAYPNYVARISGLPYVEFASGCYETPATANLLQRFTQLVVQENL